MMMVAPALGRYLRWRVGRVWFLMQRFWFTKVRPRWEIQCVQIDGGTVEAHVMPLRDHIDHETSDECACGVTMDPVKDEETGAMNWVAVHHSLDGRELDE